MYIYIYILIQGDFFFYHGILSYYTIFLKKRSTFYIIGLSDYSQNF